MFRQFGVACSRVARVACVACFALLSGCVYAPYPGYYPVTQPAPSPAEQFDRAWNAALDAVKESGVRITNADASAGIIRGIRDQTTLLVTVARQADGTMQVEVEAKSPQGRESGLAKQISESYQRRMNR